MANIGTFTKTQDGFTGSITTLTVKTKATLKPAEGNSETGPDYRVFAGEVEIGAAWKRTGKKSNRDYLAVKLRDPSFAAPLYANLIEQDGKFTLIWN
jgi:uncharacterized protein (DUF736 family)